MNDDDLSISSDYSTAADTASAPDPFLGDTPTAASAARFHEALSAARLSSERGQSALTGEDIPAPRSNPAADALMDGVDARQAIGKAGDAQGRWQVADNGPVPTMPLAATRGRHDVTGDGMFNTRVSPSPLALSGLTNPGLTNPGPSQPGALEGPENLPVRLGITAELAQDHSAAGQITARPSAPPGYSQPNLQVPSLAGAPVPEQAWAQPKPRLGDLSMRYETGQTPGHEAQAAGVVSSGAGDPGGVSYGAYQFASSSDGGRQAQAFVNSPEGKPWANRFKNMDPAQPGGNFTEEWKKVAASEPDAFFQAQHDYTRRTHYDPTVQKVQDATGLDVTQRSKALQDAVWSMSVQHGRAPDLVTKAVQQAGPQGDLSDADYDRKLINQLYDTRSAYVDRIGLPDLKTRYAAERANVLKELQDQAP